MRIETALASAMVLMLCGTAALAASKGEGAVLPLIVGPDLLEQCSRLAPEDVDSFWQPAPAEVAALDDAFDAAAAAAFAGKKVTPSTDGYDRQYIGIIVGGEKRIYINAIPHDYQVTDDPSLTLIYKQNDWHSHAVVICDGGPDFFGAEYDPATNTFSNFNFNGVP